MEIVRREFVFTAAPFASCHASTIAETAGGLAAAWFGGAAEGRPDVGIWLSRFDGTAWSEPVRIAAGVDDSGRAAACWNPVLYRAPGGPLLLFYKVGGSPSTWWGEIMASDDGGTTWSPSRRLPPGFLGPVKNKPVLLAGGILLCPSSTEDDGWRVRMEATADLGLTWSKAPVDDPEGWAAIQPTILVHPGERLQILCRSRRGRIVESRSGDAGRGWTPLKPTSLPNPNSGIDAVTLAGGRHLLVYNPVESGRTPLVAAVSADGESWTTVAVLDEGPGEYSYPAVIQDRGGLVHVTYTWRRERIRHVVLKPR